MKNLDLKQIGVQELSAVEQRDVEGGFDVLGYLGAVAAVVFILDEAYDVGYYLGSQMP